MSLSNACVVGYHYPCIDGIFAALVVREKLRQSGRRSRFVPLSTVHLPRVESLSLQRNDEVFLVDFASPRGFVEDVAGACRRVVVLDHHVTAREALQGAPLPDNVELHFDLEKCAATLAVQVLAPVQLPPRMTRILALVEDSDLWRMESPETRWFRAGMGSLQLDFNVQRNPGIFETLLALNLDSVLRNGKRIHTQQSAQVEDAMRSAFRVEIGGREAAWGQCLAVQGSQFGRLRSAIGNGLAEESRRRGLRGIGIVAYHEKCLRDASKIKLSFRSVREEDTTPISVALGGGGHTCASSCTLDLKEFQKWRL